MIDSPDTLVAVPGGPAAPLERDVLCIHCEYNLRTLNPDGLCPECGNPVEHSLRGFLEQCGRRWLRRMYWGAGLLCPLPILLGIWPLSGLLGYVSIIHWFIVFMSVAYAAGLWIISAGRRQKQVLRSVKLRWALRASAVCCSIYASLLLMLVLDLPGTPGDLDEWMGFAAALLLPFPAASSLLLLASIARGDGDRRLANTAKFAAWSAAATIGVFGVAFFVTEGIHLFRTTDRWITWTFPIAGAVALWSSLALGRFQQRLRRALRSGPTAPPLAANASWRRNMVWGLSLASIMPLAILFFMDTDEKGHLLWTALICAAGLWLMGSRGAENRVFPSWLRWTTRTAGIAIGLVAIANLFEIDAHRWQYRQRIGFAGGAIASIAVLCVGIMLARTFGWRNARIWGGTFLHAFALAVLAAEREDLIDYFIQEPEIWTALLFITTALWFNVILGRFQQVIASCGDDGKEETPASADRRFDSVQIQEDNHASSEL